MAKKTKAMLEEEIKVLKKHNDELNDRIESLMLYSNELEAKVEARVKEHETLDLCHRAVVANRNELLSTYEKQLNEIDHLKAEIASLNAYNAELIKAIGTMKEENESLRLENSHLVDNGFIDQAIDAAVEFTDQKRIIPPVQFVTEGTYVHRKRMYGWTRDMM